MTAEVKKDRSKQSPSKKETTRPTLRETALRNAAASGNGERGETHCLYTDPPKLVMLKGGGCKRAFGLPDRRHKGSDLGPCSDIEEDETKLPVGRLGGVH